MELRSEGGTVPFPGQKEYSGSSSFFGDLSVLAINETLYFFLKKDFIQFVVLSRFLSSGKKWPCGFGDKKMLTADPLTFILRWQR